MMDNYKITILGLDGIGKSSVANRFFQNRFINPIDPLIEKIYRTTLKFDDKNIQIDIIDTSSQKESSKSKTNFMKNSDFIVIVFAVNDRSSFEAIDNIKK